MSSLDIDYLCTMIQHGKTLISEDLLEEVFVCDLSACKGACCVEGGSGAPLEEDEKRVLDEIWPVIREYLPEENQQEVDRQGTWVTDWDGEPETPLRKGCECAYAYFDADGVAKCAIERAHLDGVVDFKKPVSCHAYPVRITSYEHYDALNYHRWPICDAARVCGQATKLSVLDFCKDALIRKFGESWYAEAQEVQTAWRASQDES